MCNYNFVGVGRIDGYGGAGIFIRRSIRFSIFNINCAGEAIGITTLNLRNNINAVVAYMPPSVALAEFQSSIINIFGTLGTPGLPTVIAGDFNAKAYLWGNSVEDRRGEYLAEKIEEADRAFAIYVRGLKRKNFQLLLDDLSSARPADMWRSLKNVRKYRMPKDYRNSWQESQNAEFLQRMVALAGRCPSPSAPVIPGCSPPMTTHSSGLHSPASRPSQLPSSPPLPAPSPLRPSPPPITRLSSLPSLSSPVSPLRTARTPASTSSSTTSASTSPPQLPPRTTPQMPPRTQSPSQTSPSGLSSLSRPFQPKLMQSTTVPLTPPLMPPPSSALVPLPHTVVTSTTPPLGERPTAGVSTCLHFDDFLRFLDSRNAKSAAGPYGISYAMLRKLTPESKYSLFTILDNIWKSGVFPESWREVRVKPIPKRGKDPTDIGNFRPVSLLSVLLKCVEGLLKVAIQEKTEKLGALPERSYAFRPGRSTSTCINDLINNIYLLKAKGHHVLGFCADIEKAYDTTRGDKLAEAMRDFDIAEDIISWITDFIGHRRITLGNQSVMVSDGLPQGSGLSPLLFNIYTATLHELSSDACSVYQFADDFFLVVHDRDFGTARQLLESKVLEFRRRCQDLDLQFNLDKINSIHFNRRKRPISIALNGIDIKEVAKIKYLGFIISANGSARDHVEGTVADLSRRVNFMKILSGCRFGIDPRRALIIYKAVVRSKIEYAGAAFSHAGITHLRKLRTCANEFLRRALGLLRSTPLLVLYHMADEMPIRYRLELSTAKEIAKSMALGHPVVSVLQECNDRVNTSYMAVYREYRGIFEGMGPMVGPFRPAGNVRFFKDFFQNAAGRKKEASTALVGRLFAEKMGRLS
ncbi:uncharacterized protein LOC131994810 [Stomoxys calcitrans]|uniref:uncharacterized protein LOC131994810 n=1 Tax=Stomoxys calcitrans TaxID=35570 RepID=UPI0027E2B2B9|nr:uncharacterized protein LOC131994810 [Stomoxys calcitrans]